MKFIFHVVIAMLISGYLPAQTARLSGQLLPMHIPDVTALTNISGFKTEVAPTPAGKFSLNINSPEKGIYSLGEAAQIYLEPGFDLEMKFTADSNYVFTGKGSEENNLFITLRKLINEHFVSSPYQFLSPTTNMDVDKFLAQLTLYKKDGNNRIGKLSNSNFRELIKKDFDFYTRSRIREYANSYGIDSLKQISFFKLIESKNYTDAMIDSAGRAMFSRVLTKSESTLLDSLVMTDVPMDDEYLFRNSYAYRSILDQKIGNMVYSLAGNAYTMGNDRILSMRYADTAMKNAFIRNYLIYENARGLMLSSMSTNEEKESGYRFFIDMKNMEANFVKDVKEVYNNWKAYADKKPAPDFVFSDVKGTKVSLKDLRGKYVYIDIWATWCGPCKAEIPFLAKMEEEFKGRNIHFVSLSVDNPADHGKWMEFVKKNNLKGIQLMTDKAFESDFIKKFNVGGIPRFILIDPQGNIVSANAKRPSNPELKKEFEELL